MTTLVMMAILIFGIMGYRLLPVSDLPNVDFPTLQVTAPPPRRQPRDDGLGRRDAARAAVHDDRGPRLDDLDEHPRRRRRSRSSSASSRSLDAAAQDVQAAITAASRQLPADMPAPPVYQKVNPADQPILYMALTLDDAPALGRRRVRRDEHGPADLDRLRGSRRSRSSARRSTPSASRSTRGPSRRRESESTRSPTPSAGRT